MPDLRPLPALAARQGIVSSQIRLHALPEGTVLQVVSAPDAPDRTVDIQQIAAATGLELRVLPLGQWLLVGDQPTSHADTRRIFAGLAPSTSGIDQSHGRVRIGLAGPMAAAVLSKGTAVDLDLQAFPIGRTAATLIGHISAYLTRLDRESFEIIPLRGFAAALWDDLALMCAEFA